MGGDAIATLQAVGSGPLGLPIVPDPPDTSRLWGATNGFFVFESALLVRPVDNLYLEHDAVSMKRRGELATLIKDAPDGTVVRVTNGPTKPTP